MTQLNSPHSSTAWLTGFLRSRAVAASQEGPALVPILALLSPIGLRDVRRSVLAQATAQRSENAANFAAALDRSDVPFDEVGTSTWDGLPLHKYLSLSLSLLNMINPMHLLWSDGRWNKLTVAHGRD